MFAARGLEGPEDGAHDGAADPDEGDHHDEPPDGDGLRHVDAAAVLAAAAARDAQGRTEIRGATRRCVAAATAASGVSGGVDVVIGVEAGRASESGPGKTKTKSGSLREIGTGRQTSISSFD